MRPEDFIGLEGGMPIKNKWVIVTNNINAVNAYGEMSHVWLTNFIIASEMNGFMTFDTVEKQIIGLTHYKYA